MSNKDRYELQLKNLVHSLSRSLVEAGDEEIQEDARIIGFDLDSNATELKQMFAITSRNFHQRKLREAQEAYKREVQNLQRTSFRLPATAAEQRALLGLVAAQQAASGGGLTAKFRDFETLSDADVTSLLEELAALGLLPEIHSKD
jgi:hypothetical protein